MKPSIFITQRVVALMAGTPTLLAPAAPNGGRRYLYLQNIGASDVTLDVDNASVAAGAGWLVPSGGGGMGWANGEGAPANAIYGVAPAATTVVVLEG